MAGAAGRAARKSAPARPFTGETQASIAAAVAGVLAPALLGEDPLRREALRAAMDRRLVGDNRAEAGRGSAPVRRAGGAPPRPRPRGGRRAPAAPDPPRPPGAGGGGGGRAPPPPRLVRSHPG